MAKLPSNYQEVEYVQSSGTQYIDTGVNGIWTTLQVQLKFNVLGRWGSSIQEDGFFGGKGASNDAATLYRPTNSDTLNCWSGSGTAANITTNIVYNIDHTLDLTYRTDGRTIIYDGTTTTVTAGVSSNANNNPANFAIFTDGTIPVAYSKMKLYNFKLYKNGTLVRDFIPCYRKSDGVIGLRDTVGKQFYTNSGSGTFTKGPNVEYPPEYKLHGHIGTWHMELVKDYSAMQGPAPDGFHVPLSSEWQGLRTTMHSLSLSTLDNWRINLHMPVAGNRDCGTAQLYWQGSRGYYWASSTRTASEAYLLKLDTSVNTGSSSYRSYGFSVRCFKNSFTTPTSSWTVINGTLGSAGIFRNQTDGLISITSDGITGYTIQDKNLGATQVYNNGDTLNEANCGKYYQRGNNYGFDRNSVDPIATSSTQVDASNYGPGNYYSSSTFIKYNGSWDSSNNGNLWGGETGVVTHYIPR